MRRLCLLHNIYIILFPLIFSILVHSLDDLKDDSTKDPFDGILNRDKSDWIDPHDFGSKISKSHDSKDGQTAVVNSVEKPRKFDSNCPVDDVIFLPYFKQYILGFLAKLNLRPNSGASHFNAQNDSEIFDARLKLSKYQLDVLANILTLDYLDAKILQESLDVLDNAWQRVILLRERTKNDENQPYLAIYQPIIDFLNSWLFRCVEILILSIYILVKVKRCSWFKIICLTYCIFFAYSVVQTWYRLSKEKEAEYRSNAHKNLAGHCLSGDDPDQSYFVHVLNFIKKPFSFTEPDKCVEYHKSLLMDPFGEITPVQAIAVTVTEIFVAPLKLLGHGIGQFFVHSLRDLPVTLWIPVLMLFAFVIVTSFFFLSGYKINMFYGLFKFEPSDQSERLVKAVLNPIKVKSMSALVSNNGHTVRKVVERLEKRSSKSISDLRITGH